MTATPARRAARSLWTVAILSIAMIIALAPLPAQALTQGPYTLEVLVDGRPLSELYGRGRNYVEAVPGREYSLRLSNHTGRRVAIAVSVDGLNSIDARTTTPQAGAKWILEPYESIVLDGWQTSEALARHFYFTSERRSYGAWLGKTDNLGVIAAAVFRERSQPIETPRRGHESENGAAGSSSAHPGGDVPGSAAEPAPAPDAAAGGPLGGAPGSSAMEAAPPPPAAPSPRQREGGFAPKNEPSPSDDYAATGIGRQVDHEVENVRFNAERTAAAVLELRYEYRPALVKLGLVPRERPVDPLQRREHAQGFDPAFAPDPYYRPDGR
jgi:hypothetical protein